MEDIFIASREDGKFNVKTYDEQGFEVYIVDTDFATLEEAQACVRKIEKNVKRVEAVQSIVDYAEGNFNFPVMVTPVSVVTVDFKILIDELDDYVEKAIADYEEAHRYDEDFVPMTEDEAMEQYVSECKAQVTESTNLTVELTGTEEKLNDFDNYDKAHSYVCELVDKEQKEMKPFCIGKYSIRDNVSGESITQYIYPHLTDR